MKLPESLPELLLQLLEEEGVPRALILAVLRRCQPQQMLIPARWGKRKNHRNPDEIEQGNAQLVSFWADAALIKTIQVMVSKESSRFPTFSDYARYSLVYALESQQALGADVGTDLDVLRGMEEQRRHAELMLRARSELDHTISAIRKTLDLQTSLAKESAARYARESLRRASQFQDKALQEYWTRSIEDQFGYLLREEEARQKRGELVAIQGKEE